MQAALKQAALPEPFKVLGKKLHPYTIGHDVLLGLFESGFAVGATTPPTFEDLLVSVWICSHRDYDTVFEALCSPATRLKLKIWGVRCGLFDIGEAFAHFQKYVQTHTVEPDYWVENPRGGNNRPSGIPFSQFLKVTMRREFGMSEQEALNTPYCQANFNYLTLLEGNGKIRLMSEGEKAAVTAANDPELERKLAALAQRLQNN